MPSSPSSIDEGSSSRRTVLLREPVSGPSNGQATSPGQKPSLLDGLKTIRLSDLTQVHKMPCARESFLTGMGVGFGVGGIRLVFAGS